MNIGRTARYVTDLDIEDYLRLGWMCRAYLGERGGRLCFLMIWLCDCEAVEPVRGKYERPIRSGDSEPVAPKC